MTTSALVCAKHAVQGDGSTVAFAMPFEVPDTSLIRVYQIDTLTSLVDKFTTPSEYSVSGTTVTMVTAPASTDVVLFVRVGPLGDDAYDFLNTNDSDGDVFQKAELLSNLASLVVDSITVTGSTNDSGQARTMVADRTIAADNSLIVATYFNVATYALTLEAEAVLMVL